jgi:hypothetical protein
MKQPDTGRCALLGPLGLVCSACCSGSSPTPTAAPLPADPHSMISLCMSVTEGKSEAQVALAKHPLVDKMSRGMRPQVVFRSEEFAAAAFAPEHDPRFSWKRLRQNAGHVRGFAERLARVRTVLVAESLKRATEFLPVALSPADVTINLVCGSPWDAFVLIFDKPELFFDLGWHADQPPEEAIVDFRAILTHELWHLAFLDHQRKRWPKDYRESADPRGLFLYRMLNEGVGHYYSMRHRLYPTPSWPDFALRAQKTFALLEKSYLQYLAETDVEKRRKLLWSSHAGVPFWEKWGAVPGAITVYVLERELGRERVKELIASEPFSLFVAYDEVCHAKSSWPRLPAALVNDARRALDLHRQALE